MCLDEEGEIELVLPDMNAQRKKDLGERQRRKR